RYVPLIMGEWDKKETYEGLSIVTHEGNSYTSKKRVPVGIDILNEEYWVVTGNYNAQVDQYRQEVRDMGNYIDGEVSDLTDHVNSEVTNIYNELDKKYPITKVFDDSMNQYEIQNILNNSGSYVFKKGLYQVDLVHENNVDNYLSAFYLTDNTHITFEEGAVIKLKNHESKNYNIFAVYD